ncbi:MAG: MGMT family protein [Tannerella sp.]|jgi:methylated-DNA-protein-cysteine methyltransferase-like protein|nr:MGMT family protein [Tannerella sp.]
MLSRTDKDALAQAVYDIVRRIPSGRATSYGAIAKATGYPNLARMVGRIMKNSGDYCENLPAHRVVNSQGILSGKEGFGPSGQMHRLLELEGITVTGDKISNWKNVFWDPIKEIGW